MNKEILSKIQGCLMGIMIGDAMGAPCEIMSYEEIQKTTNGGIKGFQSLGVFQRRLDKHLSFKVGDTTDDWAFTKALVESLIANGGYNHMDCARRFVEIYRSGVVGAGCTTRDSLKLVGKFLDSLSDEELANYKQMNNQDLYKKFQSLINRPHYGVGAGVAMRIVPLAIFNKNWSVSSLYNLIRLNGSITHLNKGASDTACLIGCIIHDIFCSNTIESNFNRGYLLSLVDHVRAVIEGLYNREQSLYKELSFVEKNIEDFANIRIRFCTGIKAFTAINTVAFSVAVFARNINNFREGILEAVNAGGDTDTTASMVGAMLGAYNGLEGIPQEWREFRSEFKEAERLGEELYNVIFSK